MLFRSKPPNTRLVIALNFTRIFKLGPLVSLNGSPTVSPLTAAFLISLKRGSVFGTIYSFSIYFLALSHAPPLFAILIAN